MRNELSNWRGVNRPFRFFEELENDFFPELRRSVGSHSKSFIPSIEVEENDSGHILSFDVPGIPKDDIHLEVQDGLLKIWGERKKVVESDNYSEKSYGKFERSFSLPENADAQNVQASYEHGVLSVMIPKKASTKPKKITVVEGSSEFLRSNKDTTTDQ